MIAITVKWDKWTHLQPMWGHSEMPQPVLISSLFCSLQGERTFLSKVRGALGVHLPLHSTPPSIHLLIWMGCGHIRPLCNRKQHQYLKSSSWGRAITYYIQLVIILMLNLLYFRIPVLCCCRAQYLDKWWNRYLSWRPLFKRGWGWWGAPTGGPFISIESQNWIEFSADWLRIISHVRYKRW